MKIEKKIVTQNEFTSRTRRSFVFLGLGALTAALGIGWIFNSEPDGDIQSPLRAGFKANEKFWKRFVKSDRANTLDAEPAPGSTMRTNGQEGLEEPADLKNWKLEYESPYVKKTLSLSDLQKFARSSSNAEFRCVEGWSTPITYEGIKFSDFLAAIDPEGMRLPYVGLETPDAEYYVSIDMESMLHQQTMLVDQMFGKPLGPEHGEPLRLIIPIKYGIKNLKRIGKIFLAENRPRDYWTENGYDWYSGH